MRTAGEGRRKDEFEEHKLQKLPSLWAPHIHTQETVTERMNDSKGMSKVESVGFDVSR